MLGLLSLWSINTRKTKYTVLYAYGNPTAHFKGLSWNSRGQLLIQSLNESGIDNWTLQNALLCLLTLKLSTPIFSRGCYFTQAPL